MRFAVIVLAALVGWLWFAAREEPAPAPAPTSRARRADLGDLHVQVAAATQHATAATHEPAIGAMPVVDDIDDEPARRVVYDIMPAVDDEARDADLSGLAEQLEAVGEVEDIVIVDETGQRVSVTLDPVPFIANIPARTTGFSSVPEDADIQTQNRTFGGEGVSFSSNCTTENVYVIDGAAIVEEDVVDLEGGIVIVD